MVHPNLYQRIDRFVASTRAALFVRRADNLLMIRPDKTLGINRTAAEILAGLYNRENKNARRVLDELAPRLGVAPKRLLSDTDDLIQAVGAMLNEDFSPRSAVRFSTFNRGMVAYPTLAEIALTYGCQNRCLFCYAASPKRKDDRQPMTTSQVKRVMGKIFFDGQVPSLSFTGGESTLRRDLPELIRYGRQLGFRVNLITNGIRAARVEYARELVRAGLDSAQVSLEAADSTCHDRIAGRSGAHGLTLAGIRNFQRLGIHVHTNTTLCRSNLAQAESLIRFVARQLGLKTLSMNMVIRTGQALGDQDIGVSYSEVAAVLPGLLEVAREAGVKLVWYSPIPYCIFNPVLHGLGAKSCACVDGILSVDPSGQVLPCSSFQDGIGSLLDKSFDSLYNNRLANYWKKKKFVPPVCETCPDVDVCAGGCPLYWDAAGSFDELPRADSNNSRHRQRWERRRAKSKTFGVAAPLGE